MQILAAFSKFQQLFQTSMAFLFLFLFLIYSGNQPN